jgi:dipeptidase E
MKLLLTSGGITNDMLAAELEKLVGKKFNELKIAFVPTAAFSEPDRKDWLINDLHRMQERGAAIDLVDIAQLPKNELYDRLAWSDVIFVGGGNTFYLSYWMQKSGMFEMLPELIETRVYAGISAGSMVATATVRTSLQITESEHLYDESYDEFGPSGRSSAEAMKWVDFAFRPHLNSRYFPNVTEEKMQEITNRLNVTIYVVDDRCAVKVDGSNVDVVGDGEWHKLEPVVS